ncbi:hypothetical protein GKZ90_0014760 [Flavobacterium sp. MC2016-06]|uniref:hypothetical protein n=1 Tax=Flavobacterium sp. MC2016-06 TaxID=2676308 RepID=UPI0012BA9212|nr:hypothetical protein [Flavobacterium sp. MC2016-06]MBU3859281.1 hypothetical protein [Flavobacterium sp. MC2016-06]
MRRQIINKIKILLSLLSIYFFSNFSQKKDFEEFSFDKLQCEKIIFKDISLGDDVQIYNDNISAIIEAKNLSKSKIHKIKLSDNYPIYHGCYDSIPNYNHDNNGEYLQFYDTKININSILKSNKNKQVYSPDYYLIFTGSIDFFEFKGNDFVLLSARDRRFFRNLERNYWILLNVKNKEVLKYFCFIDGYTIGKDCFGDFNNDGLLDYMNWDFLKDKIAFYSLKNDDFQLNKKYYIKLRQSKEQEEVTKEQGIVLLYDLFDKKKSKWFYKF